MLTGLAEILLLQSTTGVYSLPVGSVAVHITATQYSSKQAPDGYTVTEILSPVADTGGFNPPHIFFLQHVKYFAEIFSQW